MTNFKFPYFARDIAEFWRRWHISLTTWFRDYLYIPLGGSRVSKTKAIRNVFVIFLVSGFWHGANWTFIVWGGIHALLFIPLFLRGTNRKNTTSIIAEGRWLPSPRELLQMGWTFTAVTIAWVFFRSEDLPSALHYLAGIPNNLTLLLPKDMAIPLAFSFMGFSIDFLLMKNLLKHTAFECALLTAIILLKAQSGAADFIYFQF